MWVPSSLHTLLVLQTLAYAKHRRRFGESVTARRCRKAQLAAAYLMHAPLSLVITSAARRAWAVTTMLTRTMRQHADTDITHRRPLEAETRGDSL